MYPCGEGDRSGETEILDSSEYNPHSLCIKCRHGEDIPLIDRIVRVSCALTNICNSVVPFD